MCEFSEYIYMLTKYSRFLVWGSSSCKHHILFIIRTLIKSWEIWTVTALWCTSAVPNHANQVVSTDSTDPYHRINRPVGHEQFYQFFVWIILQTRCGETTQINIILCINMPPLGHNLFWNNVTVSKFNGGHKSFTKNYTLYCSWASFLFAAVPVEHEFKERNPVISGLNRVILLINILLFRICSSSVFSHLREWIKVIYWFEKVSHWKPVPCTP